ncbi:2-hydroxyacid dehydrogenase [Polluticaenibacter yanchengensis]|uniref:D-glycerate dehydrogenase n=2 Tax=Polluticaenibacter yanchengensis TaxID=3014562 RepID=A0ABT4UMP0_9BACT|nr:D-glycerate dehydrogenase [Chitinophagaceae bacterium LY-5]
MKVFITRQIQQSAIDLLEANNIEVTQYLNDDPISNANLISTLKGYDGLLSVGHVNINEALLTASRHLKGIALMSVGYDNVDIDAATNYKIPVSNTPNVLNEATSDVAFLLILNVSRKAIYHYNRIVNDQWHNYNPTAHLGIDITHKTLGIFGLGRIGISLARKCKAAFNMDIIYHNRNRNPEAEALLGARYVSFDELLEQSDILSVHANLSVETNEIFNAAAFDKMKPSSIFINTARGKLHNETDLIQALIEKKIWGAGLDVTNPEPMHHDNILLTMENVCIMPHIGSATVETRDKMAIMSAQNIIAALKGKRMPQCINVSVYGDE